MALVPYSPGAVQDAVDLLKGGGILAFPTETYYGLAVDPFNDEALARLFRVKGRSLDKAVLCLVDEPASLDRISTGVDEIYQPLMAEFWPGPLTLLFEGAPGLSSLLTCNKGKIGVRVSSNPAAQALCLAAGQPITATSANLSGMSALTTAREVEEQLGDKLDLIIDGGRTPGGLGSTIVGIDGSTLTLIRAGILDFADILRLTPAIP